MSYKFVRQETALGTEYCFEGPGLSRYANGVHFLQVPCDWALECLGKERRDEHGQRDAETIARLLACAFEAGRKDAKAEFRRVLGLER